MWEGNTIRTQDNRFYIQGEEYEIKITLGVIEKLEEDLGETAETLVAQIGNVTKTPKVVYHAIRDQLKAAYPKYSDFRDAVGGGDTLGEVCEAYTEGLIDFFPSRQRLLIRDLIEKQRQMELELAKPTTKETESESLEGATNSQE